MKMQKALAVLSTVSLLGLSVACNDRYAEGVADGKAQGYAEGYDEGYAAGDADGFERAKVYFASADYNDGWTDGNNAGLSTGYDLGYDIGYDDGLLDGYDIGYDDGLADGYDIGYDDGWYDAGGLSVGKTKNLRGYSNLLSMVHNDLFNYSKIAAPQETKRGVLVNGQLLMSETSLTNKDTLKRAAVVEQYLVTEMAKQVKGKFGLSAERSLKVAKAANHFRKYSSNRALTAEDTNAYAEEILGVNFKAIENAYTKSMKGDISVLNSVLEKAAEKNGVSPEKMGVIMTKLFI